MKTVTHFGTGLAILFSIILMAGMGVAGITPTTGTLAASFQANSTEASWAQGIMTAQQQRREFHQAALQALEHHASRMMIERRLDEIVQPERLIPEFFKAYQRLSPSQQASLDDTIERQTGTGEIRGQVTIEGSVALGPVEIFAFDSHGYVAGHGSAVAQGNYAIQGLAEGNYYVMTWSKHYVDKLYPDVLAPLARRDGWRTAGTVAVSDGQIVEDINFDLLTGARIRGTVYHDGGGRVEDEEVTFQVTLADRPAVIYRVPVYLTDGRFDIMLPATGLFKLAIESGPFETTWYPSESAWADAQVLTVSSLETILSGIDFELEVDPEGAASGSISGGVTGPAGFIPLAVLFAFDAGDASFEGLGLHLLFSYTIEDLEAGDYKVYANDLLGNLIGTGNNHVGEFYDGATTFEHGTPVNVVAGTTTPNIRFTLENGGEISGQIINHNGTPLDSLVVLAVRTDLESDDPMLSHVDVAAAMTDPDGNYTINGLATGRYVVRTFSDFRLELETLDLDNLDQIIQPGKYAGEIVDQYYGDVYNILQFQDAPRVEVTRGETTTDIDMQLAAPGYLCGSLTAAASEEPIKAAAVVAIDAETVLPTIPLASGYPDLPGKSIGEDGSFCLGPLAPGTYVALAVTGLEQRDHYLSEFYDDARAITEATPFLVNGNRVEDADFTLEAGASLEGYVTLGHGDGAMVAGEDTLSGAPVLMFNADNGRLVSYDYIQFTGGYRVDRLPAGSYKVMTVPVKPPFAATYAGGGLSFDDPASEVITLAPGERKSRDVALAQASGSISGQILDTDANPLSGILVLAYDATGHTVGLGMSGYDLPGDVPLPDAGQFDIHGLADGQYFLRTFSLSAASALSDVLTGLLDDFNSAEDPLSLILGGLGSLDLDIDISVYTDLWYPEVPEPLEFDVQEFLFTLLSYGFPRDQETALFPVHLPMPYYATPPAGATAVQVSGGEQNVAVSFELQPGEIDDLFTDVERQPRQSLPERFAVSANYPNPFNPSTRFSISLPRTDHVAVRIYDTLGRRVATVMDRQLQAGDYTLRWSAVDEQGRPLPAGLYLARIETPSQSQTVKMMLVK